MADQSQIVRSPGLARAILHLSSSVELREVMLGDLEEEFSRRAQTDAIAARLWYLGQVLSSAAPLMQARINRSATFSAILVVVLTGLAFACVNAWDIGVARTVALAIARSFRTASPIPYARLAYVVAQMLAVGAAALVIATLTFHAEKSIFRNTATRLGMLAVVVLAPQFIALAGPRGYSLDFVIPWSGAMMLAIAGGAALAARIVGKR